MTLPKFAVKKRYTTIAAVLAVILLGIGAFLSLNIQLNPDIDPVVISVLTTYSGVSARDVAEKVNEPIEEELGTIEGVEGISSDAMEGTSIISVEFDYDKDINVAAVDVQNVINRIRDQLPAGIDEPQVKKFSTADKPILTVAINGPRSDTDLRTLTDNQVTDTLQLAPGVASIDVYGGKKRQIQVRVDRDKLNAYNISIGRIVEKLDGENLNFPGGRITQPDTEYLVRTVGEYENIDRMKDIIIGNFNGKNVYLKDVGQIKDSFEEIRSKFRVEGKESVAVNIKKQQNANTVEVVEEVKEKLDDLRKQYPDLDFVITDDQSDLVHLVINNMASTLRLGIILTILVIFIFLNSWRSTLAVSISIPTTFVFTLGLIKAFGLSLNSVTMTGLILAIGMLVDNSIVVIENVTRHFEELDKSAFKAAIDGTNEMMLALTAGTTTSMIVLTPVMFVGGFVQQMFRPLSMTLLFAWSGSIISSFTIVPLILALVLKGREKGSKTKIAKYNIIQRVVEVFTKFLDFSRKIYINILEKALNNRAVVVIIGIGLLIITINLVPLIGSEMTPTMDSGQSYISIEAEPGSSLAKTEEISKKVEKIVEEIPELIVYSNQLGFEPGGGTTAATGASGVQQCFMSLIYTDRNNRERSIWEIQVDLRSEVAKIPGIRSFVVEESGSTSVSTTQAPLVIRLNGKEPEILENLAEKLVQQIKQVPGATNITTSWTLNNPEYWVNVDREKVAELGLTTRDVSQQIAASFSGIEADEDFRIENQKNIDIEVKFKEEQLVSLNELENLIIITPEGNNLPLRELAEIKYTTGPNLVSREELRNTLDILGYSKGRPLSKINNDIDKVLEDFNMPEGYKAIITGEQEDMQDAMGRLLISLLFAIAFVYLLLVSQFKSLIHPITIMVSLPLELVGVVAGLLLTGTYLSMPAMMGIILLSGIAVNDAIHLIEFTIARQKEGMETKDALLIAAKLRYRPILMTTFSTVAGMLPLAMELAVGTEKYSPLAIVVIGGITTSTLLLLIFVPVVYSLFEDIATWFKGNSSVLQETD